MTATPRVDREAVLAALQPRAIVERFGLEGRASGRNFRTRTCPACGPRSSASVSINLETGAWCHFGHACGGDIFDLFAALVGLDARRDFPEVLARTAELAGVVGLSDIEQARLRREHRQMVDARARAADVLERERIVLARQRATVTWERLARRSRAGEAYLRDRRGLDPDALIARDAVRFGRGGEPAAALRDGAGDVVNVVRRRIVDDGGPRILGLRGCPTRGTLVGTLGEIGDGVDVVIAEGLVDAFTACLAWPEAIVLGAHGASNLEDVAARAARWIVATGGRLLLVPDDDEPGIEAGTRAGRAAIAAGLRLGADLVVIETGHHDLNAAWTAGWRPTR